MLFPQYGQLALGGKDVEKANCLPVYMLGVTIGGLQGALTSYCTLENLVEPALVARRNLGTFVYGSVVSPLTKRAALSLIGAIDDLFSIRTQDHSQAVSVGLRRENPLNEDDIKPIKDAIFQFHSVASSELPTLNIFYATQKLGYDMALLIEQGEVNLSPEIIQTLESESKIIKEVRSAARCLAFGIPTAVGFHLYRGIEGIILKEYFPILKITGRIKNPGLGTYIDLLEEKGVSSKIIAILRHIKTEYRNPISHPKKFWDIGEAGIAFGLAMSVITAMVQDIQARKKAPSIPSSASSSPSSP